MILDSKFQFSKPYQGSSNQSQEMYRNHSLFIQICITNKISKFYVPPHLDYGDSIYHKYDPDFKPITTEEAGGGGCFPKRQKP